MDRKPEYCYEKCRFLNQTESEQDKMGGHKAPHFCNLYKKHVLHSGHHPNLIKLNECKVTIWEVPNADKINWDAELKKMSMDEFMKEYSIMFTPEDRINPADSIALKTCKEENMNYIAGIDLADPETSDLSVVSRVIKHNEEFIIEPVKKSDKFI